MKRRSAALIASLGFFSLVAQTLLFRDWLTALEGTELAIGSFFGTWLLWVAGGALAARAYGRLRPGHAPTWRALALLTLLYLPAYALEHVLVLHARDLVGVRAYEVLPLQDLLGLSLLLGAPVSFLTGFLFTLACRAAAAAPSRAGRLPVARVYVLEAAGAFVGGAGVTLLLGAGTTPAACALGAGLVLALAAGVVIVSGSAPRPGLRRL
ncbi:MAG: hypothetical protein ACC662_01465, partial [Planctomycetota bacterium]